ncbi:MAG TPA: hypothetical protein VGE07_18410 [Herpetosiphonaceae bacterium]
MAPRIVLLIVIGSLLCAMCSVTNLSLPSTTALLGGALGLTTMRHWRLFHSMQPASESEAARNLTAKEERPER